MVVWNILIILIIMICVLCFDYILHIRKIYKIDGEELDNKIFKLCENKEKGERLLNILGVMYVPVVLGMLEELSNVWVNIIIFLMVTAVFVALNCKIYKYTIRIKKLELEQQRAKN